MHACSSEEVTSLLNIVMESARIDSQQDEREKNNCQTVIHRLSSCSEGANYDAAGRPRSTPYTREERAPKAERVMPKAATSDEQESAARIDRVR